MTNHNFSKFAVAVLFALLFIGVNSANADLIGINFLHGGSIPVGGVAGAPGVAQDSWNNISGSTGGTESTLIDDSGAVVPGLSVTWQANGTWRTSFTGGNSDKNLMTGYLDNSIAGGSEDTFVTVNGISTSLFPNGYDVYVYFGADSNGRTGEVSDGTTTFSYTTASADGTFDDSSDYLLTTDTVAGSPNANYAIFSGLTGSSVTIDLIRGSSNSGIYGIQLVSAIPEPSSALLLGIGFASINMLRRRKNV